MKYCIDYRNGSMGNTVLTHVLYACNKVDIDVDNFFNNNGNAHNISKHNNTNLVAKHLQEFPDSNLECVLEIFCNDWSELLRIKMSYSKWSEEDPTLHNYKKFNFNFDEKWPNPANVTEIDFVEILTKTYYDSFCNIKLLHKSVPVIELIQYFNGDYSELVNLSENILKWEWNNQRSQKFFDKVLETNQRYLDWLQKIKSAVHNVLTDSDSDTDFELWEQAIIIAKACTIADIDPMYLNWASIGCDMSIKNVYLTQFKKELSWQNRLT